MKFQLNGESHEVSQPLDIGSLLERFDLGQRRVAVAINDHVVPRSRYLQVRIEEGDRVEVIQAIGGG